MAKGTTILKNAAITIEIEANAVTDNPLVLVDEERIVSGGNFHAEPIGFAADQIALALAEMGSISQRRIALMVDPTLSHDLPAFLTDNPGLNSGFMIAEVTSAALMSENKHLANPCVTDSTPTSANQEDHVSMAAHGAYRLFKMNKNLSSIFGIELLCASQGIDAREPLKTSPALAAPFIPNTETGIEGPASFTILPFSSCIAFILPNSVPAINESPIFIVPYWTNKVVT